MRRREVARCERAREARAGDRNRGFAPVDAGSRMNSQTSAKKKAGMADAMSDARQPQRTITNEIRGGASAEPMPTEAITRPVARPCAAGGTQRDTPCAAAG